MKYKCLVLDHDDTVVKSTPDIHYPAMVEALKTLRPGEVPLTLEDFITYSFDPGFSAMCRDILRLTDEEIQYQYKVWQSHTTREVPDFYPGFPELIREHKEDGGIICVVSHSESRQIARDYNLKCGVSPDLIFGWELGELQRKPSPYPVLEIMRKFDLNKQDVLVLDDLKPGLDMARSCDVAFAAAGWSHSIPQIREHMKKHADYYFQSVEEFRGFILKK
ncbi:MAG: HAD hydrolase-like protein [Bacillota bacterium]|nr:HAD hydrolase-like protein [Bacillota bacterium]